MRRAPLMLLAALSACAVDELGRTAQSVEAGAPPAPVYQQQFADAITGDDAAVVVSGTWQNCSSGRRCHIADANRGLGGPIDSYRDDIYERPAGRGRNARNYYPSIDIVATHVGLAASWVYYRIDLYGTETGATPLPGYYAFEINLDDDPAGDAVVQVAQPAAAWSASGVGVYVDRDDTVGGARPLVADGPGQATNGYEQLQFEGGTNTAPDAPGGATAVQARRVGASVELAVYRPFLAALAPAPIRRAAFRGFAGNDTLGVGRLPYHDDRSRASLGSPYPYLEVAGASTCPTGGPGDDGLTAAQINALESGTRVNTGFVNPCYALPGSYELDTTGTIASLAVQDELMFQVDLAVTAADLVDPVDEGDTITYTLVAANLTAGPGAATGVVLVDTLPAGVTFASASAGCDYAAGVVTCAIGAIPNGDTRTVTIEVTAPATNVQLELTNTAVVTGDGDEQAPADNTAVETTTVRTHVTCGNGERGAGEGCDDGNMTDGDGCDSACHVEVGFACDGDASCATGVCDVSAGTPGTCEPADACGNGVLDDGETCDDGNTIAGDGCSPACLAELDTDGDGASDIVDPDDDDDGLLDDIEGDGAVDTDGDGAPDSRDLDADDDGLPDLVEGGADTDGDGVADYRDLDSDGDGLGDLREGDAPCADAGDDGVCDGGDMDGDGLVDTLDDVFGFGTGRAITPTDTDGDGAPDDVDRDSDGDAAPDAIESANAARDTDGDGVIDVLADADGDGVPDVIDAVSGHGGLRDARIDTDGDSVADHRDVDADGDGVDDRGDNCRLVANPDQADLDGNGLGDACDVAPPPDTWSLQGGGCDAGGGDAAGALALVMLALALGLRRRRREACALALLAAPAVGHADVVRGQFSTERFQLASDGDGILDVEWGGVQPHLQIDLALWLGYANDPLTVYRETPSGDRELAGALVGDQVSGELVGAIGLFDRAQIGVTVPLIVAQRDDMGAASPTMPTAPDGGFALGDLRLVPKVRLLRQAEAGVDLAIYAALALPTSSGDGFSGDKAASVAPAVAVSRRFADGVRAAVNLGYRARQQRMAVDLEIDDELFAAAGVAVDLGARGVPLELDLGFGAATAAADAFANANQTYAELDVGASYRITPALRAFAATGAGVANGFGTPDWRFLAGVRVERSAASAPHRAPAETARPHGDAEPLVTASPSPNPKPSPNADPTLAPNPTPTPTQNPMPTPTPTPNLAPSPHPNLAPNPVPVPVPAPDADRDGLPDAVDNCPDTIGPAEQQGCTTAQRVKLSATRLELREPITFARGATKLRGASTQVLDDAAQVIRSHPELQIVIHAYAANAKLARKRGTEVLRYLVRSGVDVRRIDAKGHATKPPGADRIELVIPPPK